MKNTEEKVLSHINSLLKYPQQKTKEAMGYAKILSAVGGTLIIGPVLLAFFGYLNDEFTIMVAIASAGVGGFIAALSRYFKLLDKLWPNISSHIDQRSVQARLNNLEKENIK